MYRNSDVAEVQIVDIYVWKFLNWLVIFCTLHAYASIKPVRINQRDY